MAATKKTDPGSIASTGLNGALHEQSFSSFQENSNKLLPIRVGSWNPECSTDALRHNQEIFSAVKKIVKTVCPLMQRVKPEDISIRQLGGGLTNKLYLVTGNQTASVEKQSCLVRVNGCAEADVIVDRDIENRISAILASKGQAPKYFGRFLNGRVEEFYDDAVPLAPKDIGAPDAQIKNPEKPLSFAYNIARCAVMPCECDTFMCFRTHAYPLQAIRTASQSRRTTLVNRTYNRDSTAYHQSDGFAA